MHLYQHRLKGDLIQAVRWFGGTERDVKTFLADHDLYDFSWKKVNGEHWLVTPASSFLSSPIIRPGNYLVKSEYGYQQVAPEPFECLYKLCPPRVSLLTRIIKFFQRI